MRFGVFELDARTGELWKQGRKLPIQGLPVQLLLVLLERPGELVTRDELRARLWHGDTFVDFDHGLHNAMAKLREALGDEAASPRFVETLPRRGYRFIAPVESAEPAAPPPVAAPSAPTRTPSRMRWAALALVACGLGAIVAIGAFRGRAEDPSVSGRITAIAVLPLKDLANDPGQDYLAEGLTEALITKLGRITGLQVISRTSVMRYQHTTRSLPEIARELRVDALVEGSVARSGNRIRITANLVSASPERHLWADSYERDLHDVLRLQDEVAGAIADQIRVTVTPQERSLLAGSSRVDPDVFERYLKGRYFWNRRTEAGLRRALEYFQQALALDPAYGAAYAGLADTYIVLGYLDLMLPRDAGAKAKAAAQQALAIDETMTEAHVSLAAALQYLDRNWQGAERAFRRALELNPSYATGHHWYAQLLMQRGRLQESLDESARAERLDPLSPIISGSFGHRLFLARDYERAVVQLQKTIELDDTFGLAHWNLGQVYEATGRHAEAMQCYARALDRSGNHPSVLASQARALARSGRDADARAVLQALRARAAQQYVSPFDFAVVHAGLGERDEAFAWLEKAYADGANRLTFMRIEPAFEPLRADGRFASLLRRMGL